MPKHLLFKADNFKDYFLEDEKNSIEHLPYVNNINIIIGSNNSGKSRFIRKLIQTNIFKFLDTESFQYYLSIIDRHREVMKHNFNIDFHIPTLNHTSIEKLIDANIFMLNQSRYDAPKSVAKELSNAKLNISSDRGNNPYYIPTLRSAHALYESSEKKIETNIYLETLNKNYDFGRSDVKIFTGLHLHKEILNTRNSKKDTRKRFEEFEKFLSLNFFDGKEVDVVAEFNKDDSLRGSNSGEVIRVHVDGDEDRYLYELGDGIQAIIILMYQIFMAEPDSFIYIDEPELHLHPGMQRLFLEQLCYNENLKSKNLTYFITTHSNHFLDLTIEKDNVSIYAFSPRNVQGAQKQFVIKNVNAGDNDILKHLGVNNSSVFMANCSIWVEGISDRNYIKAFLRAYTDHLMSDESEDFKSIKEDIDYAFFEYAGSNIDHYFFGGLLKEQEEEVVKDINALALHNRIFLLADSDCADEGSAKKVRLEKLKDDQKPNFHPEIIEGVREIENLLTNEIWNKVLIEFCNLRLVKGFKEDIVDKIDKAFSEPEIINYADYQLEYIGNFLEVLHNRIGNIKKTNILNKIYECDSEGKLGTFIYKRELSEAVLKKVFEKEITWEHFSKNPLIVSLTEKVYNFILSSKN